jgi:hypothetical protein
MSERARATRKQQSAGSCNRPAGYIITPVQKSSAAGTGCWRGLALIISLGVPKSAGVRLGFPQCSPLLYTRRPDKALLKPRGFGAQVHDTSGGYAGPRHSKPLVKNVGLGVKAADRVIAAKEIFQKASEHRVPI